MKKLEIQFSDGEWQRIDDYCNSYQQYSPVITKYNKKENWKAISIKGFSQDPLVISKPNVLGVGSGGNLQETPLVERLQNRSILAKIPAMTERVRLMKLEAGTKISKHTDKVDKDIKSRKIIRLHIPVITDDQIKMISWLDKDNPTEFKMKKGECWWLDVSKAHSVLNESDVDRVHLVIDFFVNNFMSEVMYGVSK